MCKGVKCIHIKTDKNACLGAAICLCNINRQEDCPLSYLKEKKVQSLLLLLGRVLNLYWTDKFVEYMFLNCNFGC